MYFFGGSWHMGLPMNFVVQHMELYDWNAITCKGTTSIPSCLVYPLIGTWRILSDPNRQYDH